MPPETWMGTEGPGVSKENKPVASDKRLENGSFAKSPLKPAAVSLDFRRRAQLSELMDEPSSRDTMRACLRDLARVNRWFLAYRPVLDFLDNLPIPGDLDPIRILDVGCGYGDTLRRIERWAAKRRVPVKLTGLDLDSDTIAIAAEATEPTSQVHWVATDVFGYIPAEPPHVVISSLFTHHLSDANVVRFLGWMEQNSLLGWLVNDLSRARLPYHLFGWFARAAGLHPFVQHDGPVSIARAFSADDWHRFGAAAGLAATEFAVCGYKPARLCVSRRKSA